MVLFASLSLGTAATAVSSSIGVVALILLLVGLLSMTLKKWRHESELNGWPWSWEPGKRRNQGQRWGVFPMGQPWGKGEEGRL